MSKRANWPCRYCSTHAARLTLPLVVIGIEPGDTRTRSATLRPCELDIAEVTSRLTMASLSLASSWDSPRFFSSMMATSFSVRSSGTDIAAHRPRVISWIVASMSSGAVVTPVDDQQVLDAADDEQLAVGDEAQVSGSQPRPFGCARRRSDKPSTERALGLLRFPPIAHRDVVAVHPDLTDRSRRTLDPGLGIDDPHHRRPRHAVADQRCTAAACAPLRMAAGQFLGVEVDDLLVAGPVRGSPRTPLLPRVRMTVVSPCRAD